MNSDFRNFPGNISPSDDAWPDEDAGRRLPPAVELCSPRNLFHWILGTVECWLLSRNFRNLLYGMPFVVSLLGLVALVWWLKYASLNDILRSFETHYNKALAEEDVKAQELYLSGLMELRPGVPEYRLRLGEFLVQHDRPQAGLGYILSLAPDQTDGFAPARMWLALQARQEPPVLPLTPEQIEGQLLRVVKQQQDNVEAHRLLAEIYIEQQEWRLAEKHLVDAALIRPELNLALAKLKQMLERPADEIRDHAERAEAALTELHKENRFDSTTRIALAEAQLMLGKQAEAREILVSGLKTADSAEIRRAVSDFDLMIADRRLAQSTANREGSLQLVLSALSTDPGNVRAVSMLTRLQSLGSAVPAGALDPMIEFWNSQLDTSETPDQARLVLSQLHSANGNPGSAADVLQPLLEKQPDLRVRLVSLLIQAGRSDEAQGILSDLVTETEAAAKETPTEERAAARHAEVLILAGRLHDALLFLREFGQATGAGDLPGTPLLNQLYGTICLDLYDLSLTDPSRLENEDPLQLLAAAVRINGTAVSAIDRLARLSFSESPLAAQAEALIQQYRVATEARGEVLSLLGLYALQAGKGTQARNYLEQANAQARGRNVMILNNLAIVLVRTDPSDPVRAQDLVRQAMEIAPGHPDLLSTRGEILVKQERWPEAAADLKQALSSRPNSVDVHRLLVQVYTALNEPAMAEAHRQRLAELQGS